MIQFYPNKKQDWEVKDKIFKYLVEHEKEDIKAIDIYNLFNEDLKASKIKDEDKIRCIKAIKQWKYRPIKRYKSKALDEVVKKQVKEIQENKKIIEQQTKNTKENKKTVLDLQTKQEVVKAKIHGYEQAMYLQKRAMYIFDKIKCSFDEKLDLQIYLKDVKDIDLLDATLIVSAIRVIGEMKNGKNTTIMKDFFDILKENDKAYMFLQQNNIKNNVEGLENVNSNIFAELFKKD